MDDGTRISIHYHMSSCNYHILTSHSASRSSGTRIHTLSRHMHALYNAHHITEHDSEVDNVGVSRRMRIMNLVMILTMINIKATPKKNLSELELYSISVRNIICLIVIVVLWCADAASCCVSSACYSI